MNFGAFCIFIQWVQTRGPYERTLGYEICSLVYHLPGDQTVLLGNAILVLYFCGFYPTKIWLLFDTFDLLSGRIQKERTRQIAYTLPAAVVYAVSFPLAIGLTRIIWKL
jgi:hypothetical protein